jgi:hypothetical protein
MCEKGHLLTPLAKPKLLSFQFKCVFQGHVDIFFRNLQLKAEFLLLCMPLLKLFKDFTYKILVFESYILGLKLVTNKQVVKSSGYDVGKD